MDRNPWDSDEQRRDRYGRDYDRNEDRYYARGYGRDVERERELRGRDRFDGERFERDGYESPQADRGRNEYASRQYGPGYEPYDRDRDYTPAPGRRFGHVYGAFGRYTGVGTGGGYSGFGGPGWTPGGFGDPGWNDSGFGSVDYGGSRWGAGSSPNQPSTYRASEDIENEIRGSDHWYRPGPHTGRGPKNYTRSDDRIREDVSERLMHHGGIDATEIDVQVTGAEVTLSGLVGNRRMKWLAEEIAESVPGVKDVHNNIATHKYDELRPE